MKYSFEIRETLSRVVAVDADSFADAMQQVHEMYDEEKIVLTADDCCDLSIVQHTSDDANLVSLLSAYNAYTAREFEHEPLSELPEDGVLPLAFTTDDFGGGFEREIQVNFDIKKKAFLSYIDDKLVCTDERTDLFEVAEEIFYCSFESLIEDVTARGYELYGPKDEADGVRFVLRGDSTYLVYEKWLGTDEVYHVVPMTKYQLVDYINMSDCYVGVDFRILEVTHEGIVYPCHYVGWQPNCLIEVARDYDGTIALSEFGEDH